MSALLIARLTILEALRRRLLWALVFLTVAVVALTGLGFHLVVDSVRDRGIQEIELIVGVSQLLILVAFMFSFVLAITAAFLGAPAIAADLDSGVLLAIVARPIRRADIVVGKWLGLSAIVLGYSIASGLLEVEVVRAITGYGPPDPLAASLYLGGQAIVLLSIALLLSTRLPAIAGGAVAVVLFGVSWMTGVLATVATAFGLDDVAATIETSRLIVPLDGLWRGTIFALEPSAALVILAGGGSTLATRGPFYALTGPDPAFLAYVAVWLVAVLGLAVISFGRREV